MNNKGLNNLKNKRGFTLVELLVSAALLVVLIILFYSFLLTSGNFFNENSNRVDAQAQSRLIFEGLKKDISTSSLLVLKDVGDPVDPTSILFSSPKYAYFVYNDSFSRMDSTGNITPAFGFTYVDNLEVHFILSSPRILRVVIQADGYEMETEIFVQNADISGITTVGAEGNVIIYESAI